ncbi:FkbM family methyltransferase [Synechococcus sp. CCY 0621]|uniref:FkbM family methyltransferase n=1 Tax=Synechococcus sp. CCY 0621 TaxID=2815603 RepID=UPI001C23F9BC|nr:FkbM family methyltransferase [Synechococcus sp. CCY 0621]
MTFETFYSQNFEDVLLARVFAEVSSGFYVDVGCQDEEKESVTKYFYMRGWRGINIDPMPDYIRQYVKRKRDISILCACGSADGEALLYPAESTGLSSLLASRAEYAQERVLATSTPVTTKVFTLNTILENNLKEFQEIYFLKIDVEGYELEVLKGIDLNTYRPKVILAETTEPDSCRLTSEHSRINDLLNTFAYEQVYFDGINTWWLAKEASALKARFSYPIGIHDGFNPYSIHSQLKALRSAKAESEARALALSSVCRELGEILDKNMLVQTKRRIDRLYRNGKKIVSSGFRHATEQLRRRRIYIDVTEFAKHDAKTGIQRVTRALCTDLLEHPPSDLDVVPVYFHKGYGWYTKCLHAFPHSDKNNYADEARKPIGIKPGDIFLGLDLTADIIPISRASLIRMKEKGLRICFIIYDLLPVRHPEWWPEGMGEVMENWAEVITEISNQVIAISKSVCDDYLCWCSEQNIQKPPKATWFHLGADLRNTLPTTGLPEDADLLIEAIGKNPSFLMVGTIEPRKGYRQSLLAAEVLWRKGVNANLVIAGKLGWMMDDFMATIQLHSELGVRLFFIDSPSDEFLEMIYKHCTVLLAASEGEGFGLPLIEAARHGMPCLVRDLPVFQEVADSSTTFFSGLETVDLADVMEAWLLSHGTKKAQPTPSWITWHESADQLLRGLAISRKT